MLFHNINKPPFLSHPEYYRAPARGQNIHAIALLPLLLVRPALASEQPPVSTLTPVVVSGTAESGADEGIDNAEIRKTTATTLGDVLQVIDGVHSSTFGGGA